MRGETVPLYTAWQEARGNRAAAGGQTGGKKKGMKENRNNDIDEDMLEDIVKHLDSELEKGAVRMSVVMDGESRGKEVSHKCCQSYGRPATETVGLLDMYTDRNAGEPDRQG